MSKVPRWKTPDEIVLRKILAEETRGVKPLRVKKYYAAETRDAPCAVFCTQGFEFALVRMLHPSHLE
jgi:hypothetical protein